MWGLGQCVGCNVIRKRLPQAGNVAGGLRARPSLAPFSQAWRVTSPTASSYRPQCLEAYLCRKTTLYTHTHEDLTPAGPLHVNTIVITNIT